MADEPTIKPEMVKELRERTGAGFMDCKRALEETRGDLDKAVTLLRERGVAAAAKKAGRDAREGLVSSYIHSGGRLGVLIEVNCETDFVARNEDFQKLVRDLAMQVAGVAPEYVTIESIPAEVTARKRAELLADESVTAEARGHPREDRRGPAAQVAPAGGALRAAVPGHRPDRRPAGHGCHRQDRREHPGPPLHPLPARGRALMQTPTPATEWRR